MLFQTQAAKEVCKDQRGNALVEFALIFPVLLVILLGVIQVGLIMNDKQTLTYAAKEAARMGALTNDDSAIESIAESSLATVDTSQVVIDIEPDQSTRTASGSARGEQLEVRLQYTKSLIVPGLADEITLTANAVALIECDSSTCSP